MKSQSVHSNGHVATRTGGHGTVHWLTGTELPHCSCWCANVPCAPPPWQRHHLRMQAAVTSHNGRGQPATPHRTSHDASSSIVPIVAVKGNHRHRELARLAPPRSCSCSCRAASPAPPPRVGDPTRLQLAPIGPVKENHRHRDLGTSRALLRPLVCTTCSCSCGAAPRAPAPGRVGDPTGGLPGLGKQPTKVHAPL